uniref:Galectin n=1 Tax=Cyprinus carpio TaxID=7962 RepID=A0A8C1YJP9_CYPCA
MTDKGNIRNEEDYVGEIKGGLRPTMRLVVMGIVHKQPKSIVVLVACQSKGEGDEEIEGDVGLELKVNFSQKAVLRNARLSGQWGVSETALSFFPFAPGESFKVKSQSVLGGFDTANKALLMSHRSVTIMLFPPCVSLRWRLCASTSSSVFWWMGSRCVVSLTD